MDAGVAHGAERVEPLLIGARVDDRAVFGRGVEVVVAVVEAGGLEAPRLRVEHAERARFEASCMRRAVSHRAHCVEIAVLWLAPGRAHAEAARARSPSRTRFGEHRIERHELLGLHTGVVACALRAIGAVLGAAAGLDRDERGNLYLGRIEVAAMDGLRAEDQVRERQREQGVHLRARPVVADGAGADGGERKRFCK
jgi:hypothetical protein